MFLRNVDKGLRGYTSSHFKKTTILKFAAVRTSNLEPSTVPSYRNSDDFIQLFFSTSMTYVNEIINAGIVFLIARLRRVMFCAAMPCSSGSARRFGNQSWDCCFLAWFTIRSWRWRRKISPKYWAVSDLHGVTSRRYVIDVIEVHQTGFRPNASPTDKTFLMRVQWVSARSGVEAGPSRAESRYCLECWDVALGLILKTAATNIK